MAGATPPAPPSAKQMVGDQNAANTLARRQNLVNTAGPTQSTMFHQGANGNITANTTLSPEQQALLNKNQAVGTTALGEAGKQLAGQYQKPADVTGTTNSLDSGMLGNYVQSMMPFFDQQNENQDAKLAAMGLNRDSQAAELARMNMGRTQDAAITGAAAQFLPEAQQMAIQAYNLPMATAGNLTNLGRGSMAAPNAYAPNVSGAAISPTQAGTLDTAAYQNAVQQTQAQNASNNMLINDVVGGAGALMGMPGLGSMGSIFSGGGIGGTGSNMLSGQPQMMGSNVMGNDQWFSAMA